MFLDLSQHRFAPMAADAVLRPGFGVLLAAAAGRQAASPTARAQARIAAVACGGVLALLAGRRGAFHPATQRALIGWKPG